MATRNSTSVVSLNARDDSAEINQLLDQVRDHFDALASVLGAAEDWLAAPTLTGERLHLLRAVLAGVRHLPDEGIGAVGRIKRTVAR